MRSGFCYLTGVCIDPSSFEKAGPPSPRSSAVGWESNSEGKLAAARVVDLTLQL
ncbi:hypothetical protein M378DRAFT_164834 [Amanita muscaria Koide BX008]|uniref:Uncharacterized protein n=1 Tax=Amanita muscaria (strain Koide BX008) TaxID=946122 RepID=A0A0C2X1W6_AMAMK|nr:hypothetical protein M378DRAFT_164834 [Amanita muscaria Koide BX008]